MIKGQQCDKTVQSDWYVGLPISAFHRCFCITTHVADITFFFSFFFLLFTQIKIEGELIKIITMIMVMIFIMMIISIKWNEIFLPACFHFCISLDTAKLNYFLQIFLHYYPFCRNLFISLFINTPCRTTFRQTHFWYLIHSPNIKKSIE